MYTVLQIFLISSLNFTLVVAFCTVTGNISHTFTPRTLGLFKCIVYLYLVSFLNLTFLLLRKLIGGLTKSIIPALLLCLYIKQLIYVHDISDTGVVSHIFHIEDLHRPFLDTVYVFFSFFFITENQC